ncbi:MAG: CAP domain-containing protein [Planctomycetota bacterium]|nr:MAG: CAP domain-containing protein [Planctomycetota bacterium]
MAAQPAAALSAPPPLSLASDPQWKIEPALLTGLDAAAHSLAKAAREEELGEVLELLRALGMPDDKRAKLQQACSAECEKAAAKPSSAAVADAVKRLRAAAKQLNVSLAAQPQDARAELAELVLRLDDSHADAHALVGHVRVGDEWLTPDEQLCRARRAEIHAALRDARKLAVPIQRSVSTLPALVEITGAPGTRLVWRNVTVHTCWSAEKAERALREAVRATAVSSFVHGGKLEPRPPGEPQTWLWFGTQANYEAYVDRALERKTLDAKLGPGVRAADGFHHMNAGVAVTGGMTEAKIAATLLVYFAPGVTGTWASLRAGHLNWLCKATLGIALPRLSWLDVKETPIGSAGRTRMESDVDRIEREEAYRVAEAGLVGCRTYMAYLARRGEDPPWRSTMIHEIGQIQGAELLKTTSVVEFVQELSLLGSLERAVVAAEDGDAETAYAKGVGEPIGRFETRWRAWVGGQRRGLVQRLSEPELRLDAFSAEALEYLTELRAPGLANVRPRIGFIGYDAELSAGALLHARYLALNPEQAKAWPDAHEEYSDRNGFTIAGAWAGGHSVIMPGAKSPRAAIDAWMATFYHRLPLTDPGLLRIGWGFEKGFAVLDAASLRAPWGEQWHVAWPYDGMTDVPTSFVPELPNPVPGADQREFGYPITLQLGRQKLEFEGMDVELRLFDGDAQVDAYLTTPTAPLNVELVPERASCLIPKQRLRAGRMYRVEARWLGASRTIEWTFRT